MLMSNKRKSTLENFIDLCFSDLPWWLYLVCALLSFTLLHYFAIKPLPPPQMGIEGLFASILPRVLQTIAIFGQVVVPFSLVIGAIQSLFKKFLYKRATKTAFEKESVTELTWQDFEYFTGEYFKNQGYRVKNNIKQSSDGGVDVWLKRDEKKYIVQCKHWKVYRVGVTVIREIYGVMQAHHLDGAFVVTSGTFTHEAIEFARLSGVVLIDGTTLQYDQNQPKKQSFTWQQKTIIATCCLVIFLAIPLFLPRFSQLQPPTKHSIQVAPSVQNVTPQPNITEKSQKTAFHQAEREPEIKTLAETTEICAWTTAKGNTYCAYNRYQIPAKGYTKLVYLYLSNNKEYTWRDQSGKTIIAKGYPVTYKNDFLQLISIK
ncbi:hypothetical protein DP1421 [Desulfotalea psychrophila LSv54]|uniref:Restriction endonuclease type IV Mrr domain-containing protein n=2 Tax=Desulfotalea psychrophila TaxID=84980 RepID=Q6ANC4_DESPS|nr:hypothetical protein DP1421 [Desulfotalea psychrophila LSv54]